MAVYKDAVFRFIQQFPTTSIIFFLIFVMNIGAIVFGMNGIAVNIDEASYLNWIYLGSSIFLTNEPFSLIILITALFILGMKLEKIYGSFKFMVLFLISGIIGGGIQLYLLGSPVIIGSLITVSGFLGICFGLMLKGNRIVSSMKKYALWMILVVLLSASILTNITILDVMAGIMIGFVLSISGQTTNIPRHGSDTLEEILRPECSHCSCCFLCFIFTKNCRIRLG